MEKILTWLQTSRTLNTVKNAVNQSGFYQLGVAFLIFTYTVLQRYLTLPDAVSFFVYLTFIVSLLYLSVLLSRNVIKGMLEENINEHLLHFSSFLVLVLPYHF